MTVEELKLLLTNFRDRYEMSYTSIKNRTVAEVMRVIEMLGLEYQTILEEYNVSVLKGRASSEVAAMPKYQQVMMYIVYHGMRHRYINATAEQSILISMEMCPPCILYLEMRVGEKLIVQFLNMTKVMGMSKADGLVIISRVQKLIKTTLGS